MITTLPKCTNNDLLVNDTLSIKVSFIGLNSIVLYLRRLKLVLFTVLIFIYRVLVVTTIFIITLQCFLEILRIFFSSESIYKPLFIG